MSRHLPAWARGSPQSQASPASPESPKPYEPAWASESAAESEHSESSEHQLPDPTGMRLFACLEWACVAVAATVLAANGWLLFVLPFALKAAVQRVYIMLFCLAAIFAELNIWGFLNELSALENWVIKGLFFIFIGFGSLKNDEAIVDDDGGGGEDGKVKGLLPAEALSAVGMVALGLLYVGLGAPCFKQLKEVLEIEREIAGHRGSGRTSVEQRSGRRTTAPAAHGGARS